MMATEQAAAEGAPPLDAWLPLLRESLAQQGRFRWHLRGNSMLPTLPSDCEIEIAPCDGRPVLGDLIVFVHRSDLVAHRLVRRASTLWVAQGDGRWHPDPPLAPDQVLGVVVAAYCGGTPCWPTFSSPLARWYWIGRAYTLWLLRRAYRALHRS